MKTNYLFKARWLQGVASAIGSTNKRENTEKTTVQSAFAPDSLACRLRVLPSRVLRMAAMLCMLLTFSVGKAWGAKITDYRNIVSGTEYYIGATTSSTDYYWSSPQTTTGTGLSGTAVTSKASATIVILEGSGTSWKIKIKGTSNYITLNNGKANGKFNIATTSDNWTFSNASSLIKMLYVGSYCLQKNNTGTQFGSYANNQTNVWLETAAAAYSVTASSNNNSWGTVSVSGTTITATPADCYQVASGTSGYSRISGSTSAISHEGNSNTISVTPTSNCSIQVIFEKMTVNTYVDEIQGNDDIEGCGTHDAPSLDDKTPASSGTCAKQHWHFMGWVTAANKANPTDANIITPGTEMTANGTTYYAVWAKGTGGGGFDGTNGGTFKIYADVSGTKYYATSTISSGKFGKTTNAADAAEFTIAPVSGGFTIKLGDKYVYYTGSTNLGTQNSSYTWTFASGVKGTWRTNSATSGRGFIYRDGTGFGGYSTSNVTAGGTEYYDLEIGGGYEYSDYICTCCEAPGTALSITGTTSVAMENTLTLGTSGGNGNPSVSWSVATLSGGAGSISAGVLTPSAEGTVTVTAHQDAYDGKCEQDAELVVTIVSSTVNVTSVSVEPATKAIVVGETFTITPTVSPSNATDKTIKSWTSSATGKATVTNEGVVIGVAAGTANITCTTNDGAKTATCAVTVYGVTTLQAKDEDGNAITAGGPGAPSRSGATITAAANAGNYVFKQWQVTNASVASTTTTPTTISNPTGAVTVTAVYYKPRVIVWKVNNVEYTPGSSGGTNGTSSVAYNTAWSALTLPTPPDVGDYCGQVFMGWTTTDLEEDALDKNVPADATRIAGLNLMTSDNQSGKSTNITAETTTFHAVFADFTIE